MLLSLLLLRLTLHVELALLHRLLKLRALRRLRLGARRCLKLRARCRLRLWARRRLRARRLRLSARCARRARASPAAGALRQ
jgi:hypothetical protein